MCKAPELGKVKTRLAANVGDEAALQVYSAMFEHVLLRTAGAPCEFVICFDGSEDVLPKSEYITIRQRGNDLGERICNAVEDVGKFEKCVVIGTDAPFLDSTTLCNTFDQLLSCEVVIGPSVDGGYYLVGFNTVNSRLFDQITWSSDQVLLETLERCTELGWRAELLPPMIDVDTLGDIVMLQAPSHDHGEIVTRLRALITTLLIVVCCTVPSMADGGWIREQGQLIGKVAFQTLSTTRAYDLDGAKTTISKYSLWSVSLYAEYGLMKDLMLVLNAPMYRSSKIDGFNAVGGIGDLAIEARYGIIKGDWPISVGLGFELPTGDEQAFVAYSGNDPEADPNPVRLPTGDGELNMWINAGISHSFWPTEAFVSFDAGYNVRGLAVSDFTRQYDNGQFTNQYRVSLKGGYKVLSPLWVTLSVYRFATAGTPQKGRFTFNGLGEGVEYNAWDLGLIYAVNNSLSFSVDVSTAFTAPRAIYGGANVFIGALYNISLFSQSSQ
ncbi:MAG: TIGR04282 family arsenosugar biosynthesis glycosyltransferase [Candidatus Kapabacteria bacterium]|nr:TIGR04282 family arsenosugar biosynthesis glycosyltransferase [Candidatus Kapabacteria bacterium]